jgi:primosomal replication protein N
MNRVMLKAQLVQRGAVRYTPAGLPALDLSLKHESEVSEAGLPRKVSMEMRAVAIGEITRQLAQLSIGTQIDCTGFLSAHRNGRGLMFHITQIH